MNGTNLPPRRPWWYHATAWILAVIMPLHAIVTATTPGELWSAIVFLAFVLLLAARVRPWRFATPTTPDST